MKQRLDNKKLLFSIENKDFFRELESKMSTHFKVVFQVRFHIFRTGTNFAQRFEVSDPQIAYFKYAESKSGQLAAMFSGKRGVTVSWLPI